MTSSSPPPQKVSLSSLSDLKSTTDDTIPQLLTSLPAPYTFTQQHYLANTRLALGYAALAIAGILFYVDWKHGGWEVTRPYTLPACAAYFALNAALTYWIWMVDRGTVFSGWLTTSTGERRVLTLRSSVKKNDPTYHLYITYSSSSASASVSSETSSGGVGGVKVYQDNAVEGRFSQWFNIHGYIDKPALKSWLAKNIDVVGAALDDSGSTSSSSNSKSSRNIQEKNKTETNATVIAAAAPTAGTSGVNVGGAGTRRGKAKKKA